MTTKKQTRRGVISIHDFIKDNLTVAFNICISQSKSTKEPDI